MTEPTPSTLDEKLSLNQTLQEKGLEHVEKRNEQAKEIERLKVALDVSELNITSLVERIDRLTRFIPVGERLPEPSKKILIQTKSGDVFAGRYYPDGTWEDDFTVLHEVTGWREI